MFEAFIGVKNNFLKSWWISYDHDIKNSPWVFQLRTSVAPYIISLWAWEPFRLTSILCRDKLSPSSAHYSYFPSNYATQNNNNGRMEGRIYILFFALQMCETACCDISLKGKKFNGTNFEFRVLPTVTKIMHTLGLPHADWKKRVIEFESHFSFFARPLCMGTGACMLLLFYRRCPKVQLSHNLDLDTSTHKSPI